MNDNDRLSKTISDVAYILDNLRVLKEIYQSGSCNDCINRNCGYFLPKPGQLVRYNCPFYKPDITDEEKKKQTRKSCTGCSHLNTGSAEYCNGYGCKNYDKYETDPALLCEILNDTCPYAGKKCWNCKLHYAYQEAKRSLE